MTSPTISSIVRGAKSVLTALLERTATCVSLDMSAAFRMLDGDLSVFDELSTAYASLDVPSRLLVDDWVVKLAGSRDDDDRPPGSIACEQTPCGAFRLSIALQIVVGRSSPTPSPTTTTTATMLRFWPAFDVRVIQVSNENISYIRHMLLSLHRPCAPIL